MVIYGRLTLTTSRSEIFEYKGKQPLLAGNADRDVWSLGQHGRRETNQEHRCDR